MLPEKFQCYLVTRDDAGNCSGGVTRRPLEELPDGDALMRVAYSSLNYKDALAATGHPGVNRVFPHVPGIDAAGVVARSGVYELVEGDPVVVTGFRLGVNRWGGFAQYVSVDHDWIVPLPEGLSLRESMALGTAGFTAALCVDALQKHQVTPEVGEVVVTGATGGVGSLAVAILAKLGYQVVAVTGKTDAEQYLRSLGAGRILPRHQFDDRSGRPMLAGRWAGAVDTVGGNILGTVLRASRAGACVTACGLTASAELPTTVYPFILRGVTLVGIDALGCPPELRHRAWSLLAGPWKPDQLETITSVVRLPDLPERIDAILHGKITGRVVIEIAGEDVLEDT